MISCLNVSKIQSDGVTFMLHKHKHFHNTILASFLQRFYVTHKQKRTQFGVIFVEISRNTHQKKETQFFMYE